MPKITINPGGKTTTVEMAAGSTLLQAIQQAGVQMSIPCGGNRRCGKCLVHVQGQLGAATPAERRQLDGRPEDMRLACCAIIEGDCAVRLPKNAQAVIETAYAAWPGGLEPLYPEGFGVAVDIGTTTVSAQLFRLDAKRPLAVLGEMNEQQPFGADVLTRVVYCNDHTVIPLRDIIRGQLSNVLEKLCAEANIPTEALRYMVAAGNSIMMYILAGIEPRPLGMMPFAMATHFGTEHNFDLPNFPALTTYVPGCASAYVGADITCSILASGILHAPGNVLLIDAGTNGEMALRTGNRLVCCSTAAGPAFEGAGISCGGNARLGAIDSVDHQDGGFRYTTMGGEAPTSLCGSGLIDAAAALLNAGLLNRKGTLASHAEGKVFIGDSPVFLNQKDIRQLQLAKAAIRGGMDTLLHECGQRYEALDSIVLCGGFGSYLRPASAQRIGLIPPGTSGKTRAIGNAAGNGAAQILQSRTKQREAAAITEQMEVVELSTSKYFMKRFLETMAFDD